MNPRIMKQLNNWIRPMIHKNASLIFALRGPWMVARYVTIAIFPNAIARSWNGCATQQYLRASTIELGVNAAICVPIP